MTDRGPRQYPVVRPRLTRSQTRHASSRTSAETAERRQLLTRLEPFDVLFNSPSVKRLMLRIQYLGAHPIDAQSSDLRGHFFHAIVDTLFRQPIETHPI